MVAASLEHLSLADDLEVRGWMITSRETELLDATPAVTSNTFLDIRRKDVPPLEVFEETRDVKRWMKMRSSNNRCSCTIRDTSAK